MLRPALVARLTRPRIAALAALATATAYIVLHPAPSTPLGVASAAVFLLAAGASALNQWQERDLDRRMARTMTRPLPSGALTARQGLAIACGLIACGAALLLSVGWVAAGAGIAALIAYNLLYTPLKRVSAWAAVPGALIGMAPALIGWAATGASYDDRRLFALALFFFLWQVPHFWLLLLAHSDEYVAAGLPALTQVLGRDALARLTFGWTVAVALSAPLLAWSGLARSPVTRSALLLAAGLLLWTGIPLLRRGSPQSPPFRAANLFAWSVMGLLIADAVWVSHCAGPH